jgi:hypothetical protein
MTMAVSVLARTLGVAAPPVQVLTDNEKDARCVVSTQRVSESVADGEQKNAALKVMVFYVGRLTARLSPKELEAIVNRAYDNMAPNQYLPIAMECGEEMARLTGVR